MNNRGKRKKMRINYHFKNSFVFSFNNFHLSSSTQCVRSYRPSLPDRIITNLNETKIALCDTKTDGGGWVIIQVRFLFFKFI